MSNWLEKIVPSLGRSGSRKKSDIPEGLWKKCPKCEAVLYRPELDKSYNVCTKCNHHMRLGARQRLEWFLDADGRIEIGSDVEPVDRLKFRDSKKYKDRLSAAQKATGEKDALIAMKGRFPEAELASLPNGWKPQEVAAVNIPGLAGDRHIVVLQRTE